MAALDKQAFAKTFSSKMYRPEGDPPFDFWPYVESIPASDYRRHDCSEGKVTHVWRTGDGRFEHVLINTKDDSNVFMVIILDIHEECVVGHRLLDLTKEYGLDPRSPG